MELGKFSEFKQVIAAILTFTIVIAFSFALQDNWFLVAQTLLFAAIIIVLNVFAKKLVAYLLDADVEHQIWSFSRYGIFPESHFENEWPFGIIIPLFFTLFTLGYLKVMTFLTYETRALKVRAAKRFGFYSYTEMTEWHNGLIGAAGIVAILILSFVSYFPGFEYLSKIAAFYAFFNMLPLGKLDGSQIFFGSRVLWYTLAVITLIFTAYALIL